VMPAVTTCFNQDSPSITDSGQSTAVGFWTTVAPASSLWERNLSKLIRDALQHKRPLVASYALLDRR
jgi:hypothetical protein